MYCTFPNIQNTQHILGVERTEPPSVSYTTI